VTEGTAQKTENTFISGHLCEFLEKKFTIDNASSLIYFSENLADPCSLSEWQ